MFDLYTRESIERDFLSAKELYKKFGVNVDKVLEQLAEFQVSMHCWQGDDVEGLEVKKEAVSGGGIMATGNYPGRARNGDELRADMEKAMSLIPGKQRINLHASYAETDGVFVERDELRPEHFQKWIDWAKKNQIGIDFNSTFFAHPMADSGFTLSSKDKNIRDFWIRHAKACREIAAHIGKELGSTVVHNLWIPDGSKDLPADRMTHRRILKDSLDEIFSVKYDKKYLRDSVESKLFGIGSEAYVVGSHEFYMGYAMKNDVLICLDAGHFHPTEGIADKLSSILTFSDAVLLHVSTLEFFTGAIIPLPFFPEGLQKIMAILPFAYMQSTPFLIYNGFIKGPDILIGVLLQMIWLLMLILTGRTLMKKALKKVVIQGG
jgi:L-rhamnose isomerase